jgi:hypothetical protein
MAIEQMLSEEMPASVLVGPRDDLRDFRGPYRPHRLRLSKYQNSIRTVLVREESLGGVMAESTAG